MTEEYNLFDTNHYFNDEETPIVTKSKVTTLEKVTKRDLCEDININYLPTKLEEIEIQLDRLKQRWSEFTYLIGQRLKYINDNRLFELKGYNDFHTYVNIALKMSENNAYYYISIYEYFTEDQTREAGSKLKLIIPILNKVKKDKEIPDEFKEERLKDLRDELFSKIYNKTYREAEKIMQEVRLKYFSQIDKIEHFERIAIKDDRIIIFEKDKDIQEQLLKIIKDFYSS